MKKKLMNIEDLSAELHIAVGTARNRLSLGRDMPPSFIVGRRRLFPVIEFERWMKDRIARNDRENSKEPVSKLISGGWR